MNFVYFHFETIGSTNSWAKSNASSLSKDHVTLITASEQTDGRGRFKRKWLSPQNENLYATFAFFLNPQRSDIFNLPQVLALSASKVLTALGFDAYLKWPNDILIHGKKVGGILCETVSLPDELCIVLGIGLNVNMPEETLKSIGRPATSLFFEDGKHRKVSEVVERLKKEFAQDLQEFLIHGFLIFLEEFKNKLVHKEGDALEFHHHQSIIKGKFTTLSDNGSINILTPQGVINCFTGEIYTDKT
jgi:BirA family biotin operon repressor/biotin-[acetyl-CoA-carboxylase] ligase